MKVMQNYVSKISALCRLRYIICTITDTCTTPLVSKDGAITIAETLDEEIRKNIIDMKDIFSVNGDNVKLFLDFFWEFLDEDEIWDKSVKEYGKDWNYSTEMLSEMLEETLSV